MSNLLHRFEALWSQRRYMENTWNGIERLIDPLRGGNFYEPKTSEYETEWDRTEIYDSTGMQAANRLAKAMAGYLTQGKFFELNFRDTDLNTVKEASVWLEDVGSRIYEALQDSNFDGEMASCYLDLVMYGNGFLMQEVEDELNYDGVNFQSIPIGESYFEPDYNDQVKYFYRHLQWSFVQIVDKFGADNCPNDIVSAAEAGVGLDHKESVIFCIYERDDYKTITDKRPVVAPEERQWAWCYLRRSDGHKFSEGGYYEQPAYVTRWEKTSGSYWGFGPAHIALSTIKATNKQEELTEIRATKEIDPMIISEQRNVIGEIDLEPGGETVVKDINGIKFLFPESNFSIANNQLEDKRAQIEAIFFSDDLVLRNSPQMTATEVMERTERLIKLLGGVFGRLQDTLLNPMIERTFNILFRAGELPEVPDSVIEAMGNSADVLDINYTGALSRAMKSEDVLAAGRWANSMIEQALQTQRLEILDVINFDEMNRGNAELLGVSAKYLNSADEVEQVRQARAEQQQAAAAAEQAQREGEAMQAVGAGQQAMGETVQ